MTQTTNFFIVGGTVEERIQTINGILKDLYDMHPRGNTQEDILNDKIRELENERDELKAQLKK